jgi:hypothetical protein
VAATTGKGERLGKQERQLVSHAGAERGIVMITNINEGPVRAAMKIDAGTAIQDRQVVMEKSESIKQARPIENTESEGKAKKKETENQSTTKYLLDNNTVVFEKYDKNGDVIFSIPPNYKPVDERV